MSSGPWCALTQELGEIVPGVTPKDGKTCFVIFVINTARTFDHLDRYKMYWSDQPLLYDFKAELAGTGDRSKCDIEVYVV